MVKRILRRLFQKDIEILAHERLKDLALEKYVDDNFFLANGELGPEVQFKGKQFIKILAASFYDLVKDADNYVTMNLSCHGFVPLNVTIQKAGKLSPHDRAEMYKKELSEIKKELDSLQ